MSETVNKEVEEKVKRVASNTEKWLKVSDKEKLGMLQRILTKVEGSYEEWAKMCNASRHYENSPHLQATGYLIGPAMFGIHLNQLIRTYAALVQTGSPPQGRVRKVGNQTVVETWPMDMMEKAFWPGTIELWLEPGKEATQCACRKQAGMVAILGPGNYEAPNDILSTMFCESKVAVYSPHPNLAKSTEPFLTRFFQELIDAGYLGILGADLDTTVMRNKATALLRCPQVTGMVLTGGCATYDAVVWGGEEGKRKKEKAFDKPVLAELGAASPYIVVPGEWKDSDLDHHAGMLAGCKLLNSSAVCASPQVLMVHKEWPQRDLFLSKVQNKLKSAKNNGNYPVFYPGTDKRVESAKSAYPASKVHEIDLGAGSVRPTIIRLEESDAGSYSCKNEAFAPVLVELPLSAASPKQFLEKAQALSNSDNIQGSLSCSVIMPDSVLKSLGGASFLDKWLQGQEWGTTGLNEWGGMAAILGLAAWGAYPKHTPEDIQSGQGSANNFLMYDNVQKSVLRSPFISPVHPKGPPTLDDAAVGPRMALFAMRPGFLRLVPVLLTALGGRNGVKIAKASVLAVGVICGSLCLNGFNIF